MNPCSAEQSDLAHAPEARLIETDSMHTQAPHIALNLLGPRRSAWDFVEETSITIDARPGWAPPRRRPRRVYRKLARRQFRLHHGQGPQYASPLVGPKVAPSLQQRTTRHTAPNLAAWLAAGREHAEPLQVIVAPMMYEGNSAQAEMGDMQPLPAGWGRHRTIRVPVRESVQVTPYDIHGAAYAIPLRTKTFEAIDLALDMRVSDPHAWGVRTLRTRLTVYAAQGVSETIVRTADKRSGSELARTYSQHVAAAGQAIMRAARISTTASAS